MQGALLEDRVAVVTGSGRGIGKAIARKYLEHGAAVALVDVDEDVLESTARELEKAADPSRVVGETLDVADESAFAAFADRVVSRFGRLDILVNNAAIERHFPLFELTLDDWNLHLRNNLTACMTCARVCAAKMMETSSSGRILNISSIQSRMSEPDNAAYAVSKGGVSQLTRSLAIDLAPFEILVNCIRPGVIHTRLSIREDGTDETKTEAFEKFYVGLRKIPLARPGRPEDVAGAAVFLASDLCSYMTGATLLVDGGLSITF